MIGFVSGILLEKQPPFLLVNVNGIGYEVQVPMTTFYQLPATGIEIALHTHFVVREDAQLLYGFVDLQTRELFRELIKVNGVGPKMALAVLSALEVEELIHCIQCNNLNTLVRVPGIGRKTAERLLIEMRDLAGRWADKSSPETLSTLRATAQPNSAPSIQEDAESALVALGYKAQEAAKIISNILKTHDVGRSEDLIRLALKSMVHR
ncbi:MAG TPA: Holliday junction branch migration protein RuvA [Pseudomonadales bacterium]|nr:Holliday junction branch migration protein RuvA [Pseudomonadales bacterium]